MKVKSDNASMGKAHTSKESADFEAAMKTLFSIKKSELPPESKKVRMKVKNPTARKG